VARQDKILIRIVYRPILQAIEEKPEPKAGARAAGKQQGGASRQSGYDWRHEEEADAEAEDAPGDDDDDVRDEVNARLRGSMWKWLKSLASGLGSQAGADSTAQGGEGQMKYQVPFPPPPLLLTDLRCLALSVLHACASFKGWETVTGKLSKCCVHNISLRSF
jgi:hypothetical protein